MARPQKERLDFAGWSTDLFDNDPKIDKLLDGQGAAGFLVYFYLCQRAYGSHGYYYPWTWEDAATTARKIGAGLTADAVRQTVELCLKVGLFHRRLFQEQGIITTRGIQRRYVIAAGGRAPRQVKREYWLLGPQESGNIIPEEGFSEENEGFQGAKPGLCPPKEKERKEQESTEQEREREAESFPARFGSMEELADFYGEDVVEIYRQKAQGRGYSGKRMLEKVQIWMAEDEATGAIERYYPLP